MPWLDSQRALGIAEKWALTIFHSALFDEDQGSSAMDREGLAVFGDSRKHVMSIYDTHLVAVHATRAEARPAMTSLRYLAKSALPSNR